MQRWRQNRRMIKGVLCNYCPCGYNCQIPTPTANYYVPGDYATLTAALAAHGSESLTRINITGTHADILPSFSCQIHGGNTESTTLTGGCASYAAGLIIKTKIITAPVWKCNFSHCEITNISTSSANINIELGGTLCDCSVYNCATGESVPVSDWNAGNGGDFTLGRLKGCRVYDCGTSDGANGAAWVPGYEGDYGQRGGHGGAFIISSDIDDSDIHDIVSGNGGAGFVDGAFQDNGGDGGDIKFGDDVRYDHTINTTVANITSGNGGHGGNGGAGGSIFFGTIIESILEDIVSGNGGAGGTNRYNRGPGDAGNITLSSVRDSAITRLTTGSGVDGNVASKENPYGHYDGSSAGSYGGDILSYDYAIQNSTFDTIALGAGGNGADWQGADNADGGGGHGGRGGYFRFQTIYDSNFIDIAFGNGGAGGASKDDELNYDSHGGTGGSFLCKEYSTTSWYQAYIRDSTFTNINFGNGGNTGSNNYSGGAGGGGFCQGGGGGPKAYSAYFDVERHYSIYSPKIHYNGVNIFTNITFGQPGASSSFGGDGKAGSFGFNGGNGGSTDIVGDSGGDGMDGGIYYVTGSTSGWTIPQGGLGGSGDPSGADGTIGQVISE